MKRMLLATLVLSIAALANAELVCHRWGGAGKALTFPNTMKSVLAGQSTRLVFELSAVSKDAKVHHASLFCFVGGGQPREPAKIFVTEGLSAEGAARYAADAKPLLLEAPWYRSFDATEAVRLWIKDPAGNLGLAIAQFDGLQANRTYLEIRYDGAGDTGLKPVPPVPPQVSDLKVIHHDGQTFLTWKELPLFRPPPEKIIWIDQFVGRLPKTASQPGKGFMDYARKPAITLKELRDMQGLKVRDIPGEGQSLRPFVRFKELPEVRYRVYRHTARITPGNLPQAEFVGEARPLCAYKESFTVIESEGEYYRQRERGDSVIPTPDIAEGRPVMPGDAYYAHTPTQGGKFFYAVTAVQDGTENMAVSAANSTEAAVEEAVSPPKPVFQYVRPGAVRARSEPVMEHWYDYWLAPPFANLPEADPRRVIITIPKDYKPPGAVVIATAPYDVMFFGPSTSSPDVMQLLIEQDIPYGGDLSYNEGMRTLRSFRQCKVRNFSEQYILETVGWARAKWPVDPTRISSGVSNHFAMRHPELFGVMWLGPFSLDFDRKWNPASGSLGGVLGPSDLAVTEEGDKAWEVFDISWYLKKYPARDVPYSACFFDQPKDGNHGAEYGWQDDPKGLAALRDARQPYAGMWGGASVSRGVIDGLHKLKWDRSLPAFSNCSLDNNPGNGDPDDGDPFGQINGYLFWQYDDIADQSQRWEMTVYLVPESPDARCTVDVTPRHCGAFKAAAGEKYTWTNTALADNKVLQNAEVTADKNGLVTLPKVVVTKGKNRLVIAR